MKGAERFRYEDPKCLDFFLPMYQDMMEQLESGQDTFVNAPPEAPCTAGRFMGWFGLNAMAYGFRKGLAAARCVMEVRGTDGQSD